MRVEPKRILIVTDAWHPQVNGVVRSLETMQRLLQAQGHDVRVVGADASGFVTPLPFYPSIKVEWNAKPRLTKLMTAFDPHFVHIATEGPLGWAARRVCLRQSRVFTTSYHTRFPEYLAERMPRGLQRLALQLAYAVVRRFHAPSAAVMVATPSVERDLRARKFHRLVRWSRGVDTALYNPDYGKNLHAYVGLPRPIFLYVGRVAVEKNLPDFLNADVAGSKVVIGDGPDLATLKAAYPAAHFLGEKKGEDLARHYAAADVFVFPSKTDTFGLVLLEAAASGLRIAAYPVGGPADIFTEEAKDFAVLNDDLQVAMCRATALPDTPAAPREFVLRHYTWDESARQFYTNLQASTPLAVRRLARIRHKLRSLLDLWRH